MVSVDHVLHRASRLLGWLLIAAALAAIAAPFAWSAGWQGRTLRVFGAGILVMAGTFPATALLTAWLSRREATRRWVQRVVLAAPMLPIVAVASLALSVAAHHASIRASEERGLVVIDALERAKARTGTYPPTLDGLLTVEGGPLPRPSIDRMDWNYGRDGDGFRLCFSPGWIDWVCWHSDRGGWEHH